MTRASLCDPHHSERTYSTSSQSKTVSRQSCPTSTWLSVAFRETRHFICCFSHCSHAFHLCPLERQIVGHFSCACIFQTPEQQLNPGGETTHGLLLLHPSKDLNSMTPQDISERNQIYFMNINEPINTKHLSYT